MLTVAQEEQLDDQKLKDLKVNNYLFQAIDHTILETILQKDTNKQIWDSINLKYQGTTKVKHVQLQALQRDFEALHMNMGESVTNYFARTMVIANNMCIHGDKLEDVVVVEKILHSMTTKFVCGLFD
uniref:Retrovirus-related Pol polyprotein from transposon TNT 1-94 n=1 Tax=Cajanus cajan TaxID=3821 RepID=A0A151SDP5_CAJCA|nr:hypothetical protein KK1_025234 [Cajanus cajan]